MSPNAKQNLAALASGVLFSIGLVVSGMTVPSNVIGFLDVAGDFRPALAFVMVGAISVHALAVALLRRRARPVCADRFCEPSKRNVDARLLGGAALFGVGWGLGGFCPGPGLVALASGALPAFVFVAAMLGSMALVAERDRAVATRAARALAQSTEQSSEPGQSTGSV